MAANDTNNNASVTTADAPKAGTSGIEELMSPVMQMLMSSEYTKTLADALRSAVKGGMMDAQEDEGYQTQQFDIMASAGRQWYLDAREEERMTSAAIAEEERSRKEAESIANMDEIQKKQLVEEMLRSEKKDPIEELRDTFILKFDDFAKDRTVQNAINTDLDERTFWEKHNPFAGISKWNDNRKQKKIDKLDQNDQKEIKRGNNEITKLQRELALLNEKKAKGKDVDPEKILAIAQKMQAASDKMKGAKDRIENRHKSIEDTMAELDLGTLIQNNGKTAVNAGQPATQDRMTYGQDAARNGGGMAGGAVGAFAGEAIGAAVAGPIGATVGEILTGAAGSMFGKGAADKASGADKTLDGQSSVGGIGAGNTKDAMLGNANKSSADDALAQQDKDIERNLNTNIRPEFYRKGNDAFDAILSGNVHVDTDEDSGTSNIFDLLKGAGIAAGIAALVASVAKIGEFVHTVGDYFDSLDDSKKAYNASKENEQKVLGEHNNKLNAIGSKHEENAEWKKLKAQAESLQKKMDKEMDSTFWIDHDKVGAWNAEQTKVYSKMREIERQEMAKADGWTDVQKWQNARNEGKYTRTDNGVLHLTVDQATYEAMKDAPNETKPGGDMAGGEVTQAPAAGSTSNTNAPTAATPAADIKLENIETPEQKAAREQKSMEEGVKKAYLSPEVQAAMRQNAVETGKAIEGQLGVGS